MALYWLKHLLVREIASCKPAVLSENIAQSTVSLPQEILDLIIDYVALLPPRYKCLEACALTCRAFYPRTLICRFRHYNIAGKDITLDSDVLKYITSISITFPISTFQWFRYRQPPTEPQYLLGVLLSPLPNVRSLHIQNAEWDTMLSPQLQAALAAHSYVSVRLTRVRFKAASQLSDLLKNSLHLQRLALSDTVIDMSPGRCPRSDIEVDCLEINHQDALDPITRHYLVSLDSLRKLKICLLSYRHVDQLQALFSASATTLRVLVVHAPRSFFPDPGTQYPEVVIIPAFVHTLTIVLHDPPGISSPVSLWVDTGLSWWFDFIATASDHLVNLTIELSFFPPTTDFDLWGLLDTLAFPCLERLDVVMFDSGGCIHRYLEERLAVLKRRGVLHVSFPENQWMMYEYNSRGQIVEDKYLA